VIVDLSIGRILLVWTVFVTGACRDRAPADQPSPPPPPELVAVSAPMDEPSEEAVDCAVLPLRCNDDYLAFPSRYSDRGEAVEDCEGLVTRLLTSWDRPEEPLPEVEVGATFDVGEALLDALNIRFLQSPQRGWGGGEVLVEPLPAGPGYRQQRLRFQDPHVGTFGALLLLPDSGPGPFPAVLALPGHNETPEDHRDRRHGAVLARRGFAVLIPAIRAYDSREAEHEATVRLLCEGFSLLGLRVYEALVALGHMATHPELDAGRLALLGHSGGSATLNLVVRLTALSKALVTDTATGYLNVQEGPAGQRYILDETDLAVASMAEPINDFATVGCPVLQVAYGAPEGPEPILQFLEKSLSSTSR